MNTSSETHAREFSILGLLSVSLSLSMFRSIVLAVLFSLTVGSLAYGQYLLPVAFDQHVTMANDQPSTTIRLTGDNPNGDNLLFTIEDPPEHLTAWPGSIFVQACVFGGLCTFAPESGFTGTDSLTFTVRSCPPSPICTTSAPATITIDIVDSLAGPVAFSQEITTIEGIAVRINPTGTDPEDESAPLTYTVISEPANGQLDLTSGTIGGTEFSTTYTPNPGFIGQDSIMFTVSDGNLTSAPAAITIDVIPASVIVSAVLPTSRSVQLGTAATAFATIVNTGNVDLQNCGISLAAPIPASFTYQTTNPATNVVVGAPDTLVDISAGGSQSFVFALTAAAEEIQSIVGIRFDCTETAPAVIVPGVNTLLLSASSIPTPDIVALAATPSGDGTLRLAGVGGSGAFGVASVNMGSTGTITATPGFGEVSLPVALSLCETDSATSACLEAVAGSVTRTIEAAATLTFTIFATATDDVPFDPAMNRIFVSFTDPDGITRGSTSVAVTTAPETASETARPVAQTDPIGFPYIRKDGI